MDPKQALTKRSGLALGWPRQKLIPQGKGLEVRNAGAQISYRPWKVGKDRLGAVHSQKVSFSYLRWGY
jgi:hypothetical protein